jgi:RHS repeat-associated protein
VTSVTHSPGPGTVSSITTSFAYQGLGSGLFDQLTSVIDPLLNVTHYYYDGSGNLTSIIDPKVQTSTYGYNALGQLTSATTPLHETTTYGYSPTDDLTSITDALTPPNVTNFTTDDLGRVTQVTTPLGHTASYAYDTLDHVIKATDGNGNTTTYTYDLLGLPAGMTDAAGNPTTITRPNTLNKETVCDALSHCVVANFDYAGKDTDVTDKLSIKTVFSYDTLQRVSQANINSTSTPNYDRRTIALTYDSLDRPTVLADTITGTSNSLTNTINYQYDGVDNVVSENVQVPQGQSNTNTTIAYQYDGDSRRTQTAITGTGSGETYNYLYDPDSELTGVSGGPLSASLVYDPDGHRTSLAVGSVTTGYFYDYDSRLTSLSYNGNSLGQITYNYDNDGRVTSEGDSLASLNLPQTEGANTANTYSFINQITSWNGFAPSVPDFAGNLTEDPVTKAQYFWDSRNQLSSITGGPATTFNAAYDATMRRYDQNTAFGGTTTYLHDEKDVAQSATTGGQSNPVNNYLTMPGTGEVLAFTTTGGTYVPLHDRLGSTIGLVNSSNVLQTQYTYDPYGNVTSSGQASSYPYLFAGMELDSTGLYHTQTRYYNPAIGRFLSADGGLAPNLFTYADDDPINANDPSGRSPEYASGAGSISPLASPEVQATGSSPQDSSLDGVLMAQEDGAGGGGECGSGDCSIPVPPNFFSNNSLGMDIVDFFESLFGGGSSKPAFIPPGYRRAAHYPSIHFITDSEAQIEEYTPDQKQSSIGIETASVFRSADYYNLNFNVAIENPYTGQWFGVSLSISRDRYGDWFLAAPGISFGKTPYMVSFSATGNWMDQKSTPTRKQLENFLSGNGYNVTYGRGWGVISESFNKSGKATGFGIGSPQKGGSWNYSWELP